MTLEKAGTALTIWELIKITIAGIASAIGAAMLFMRVFDTNRRLAKNLGRKIFLYCPPNVKRSDGEVKDMKREVEVLQNSKYFKVGEIVTDFNSIEERSIQEAGIVVVGYDTEMAHFEKLVEMVKRHNKPLIVYTFELGLQLTPEHKKIFNNYKWTALSSMPLRLVSDIFAIMASFNYEK